MFKRFRSGFSISTALVCFLIIASGCDSSGSGGRGLALTPGEIRSIDGSANNINDSTLGSADTPLLRITDSEYADEASAPAGLNRANPRDISNTMMDAESMGTASNSGNSRQLSGFIWQWGQFLDHDISLTPEKDPHEVMYMDIPAGDHYFDPSNSGKEYMTLNRSVYAEGTGTEAGNPREQMNMITSWIDASNVYGSDETRASWLRTFEGGKLKTSAGNMLPFNDGSQVNAGPAPFSTNMFVAGDVRANEQLALTATHTLFVREHNRLAEEISANNPEFSDEEIYQRARKFVGAFVQAITYNEFLPALLGEVSLSPYRGYNPEVNGAIRNEFSTAIYRLGHSMIPSDLLLIEEDGTETSLPLRDAFFRPNMLSEISMESIFKGLASQEMEEVDLQINEDLRNFLFGPPGSGGFDLASLNILRGREHGLPNYNSLRAAYGLAPLRDFSEMTVQTDLADKLKKMYGKIDDVDAWVGALAEDHVSGSSVGQLVAIGLVTQFTALRDGDRFWYENDPDFSAADIEKIRNSDFLSIILRNTDITTLKGDLFFIAKG